MNYHGIETDSMLNGDGLRTVLWVSGCSHHCKGCQNPQTWDAESGTPYDEQAEEYLFACLDKPYISGLTFSGGDPLFPANREEILRIAKKVKETFPAKTIWLYTGYLYEEVKDLPVMKYVDVLVEGPFVQELKDINYHYAGSTNQRVMKLGE